MNQPMIQMPNGKRYPATMREEDSWSGRQVVVTARSEDGQRVIGSVRVPKHDAEKTMQTTGVFVY